MLSRAVSSKSDLLKVMYNEWAEIYSDNTWRNTVRVFKSAFKVPDISNIIYNTQKHLKSPTECKKEKPKKKKTDHFDFMSELCVLLSC